MSEHGEILYDMQTEYVRANDAANGYATRTFTAAIGSMFDRYSHVLRAAPASWAPLFDVDACPDHGLPYLAQFVGVRPTFGDPALRDRIRALPVYNRGRPQAMIDAARIWLTGDRHVQLYEQYGGDVYALRMVLKADEVPSDPDRFDLMVQRIIEAKPAGILLQIVVVTGMTFAELDASADDFADVLATYPTFGDIIET